MKKKYLDELTEAGLTEICNNILNNDVSFVLEQKPNILHCSNEEQILDLHINNVSTWVYYLGFYTLLEKYELCSILMKTINKERLCWNQVLGEHRLFQNEEDYKLICHELEVNQNYLIEVTVSESLDRFNKIKKNIKL